VGWAWDGRSLRRPRPASRGIKARGPADSPSPLPLQHLHQIQCYILVARVDAAAQSAPGAPPPSSLPPPPRAALVDAYITERALALKCQELVLAWGGGQGGGDGEPGDAAVEAAAARLAVGGLLSSLADALVAASTAGPGELVPPAGRGGGLALAGAAPPPDSLVSAAAAERAAMVDVALLLAARPDAACTVAAWTGLAGALLGAGGPRAARGALLLAALLGLGPLLTRLATGEGDVPPLAAPDARRAIAAALAGAPASAPARFARFAFAAFDALAGAATGSPPAGGSSNVSSAGLAAAADVAASGGAGAGPAAAAARRAAAAALLAALAAFDLAPATLPPADTDAFLSALRASMGGDEAAAARAWRGADGEPLRRYASAARAA